MAEHPSRASAVADPAPFENRGTNGGASARSARKIWIDLDNSPHVPFFRPIIDELRAEGHEIVITARDAYQVRELLEFYKVPATVVGRHYGKLKILKVLGTLSRGVELANFVRASSPDLSICHGSRGCLIASRLLGVPNITLTDYEFVTKIPLLQPAWLIVPSVIPDDQLKKSRMKVLHYPGIKEDVYLSRFTPDEGVRARLGVSSTDLLVLVRPPATEAHYHNPLSEILLKETLERLTREPGIKTLLLPRNGRQAVEMRAKWPEQLQSGRLVIPEHVEDGLNLIWNSDLVISGGGTMNREAAALGVPVYSIFRGKIGAVDKHLAQERRLILLESVEDIRSKIKLERRQKIRGSATDERSPALGAIVEHVNSILAMNAKAWKA